jgi:hypothetical protein
MRLSARPSKKNWRGSLPRLDELRLSAVNATLGKWGRLVMKLLYKRAQTDGVSGKVTFKVWAQTELDEDEKHIVQRYKFDSAKLIDVFQPNLLRMAIGVGLAAAVGLYLLLWMMGIPMTTLLSVAGGAGAGYFYYDRNRESVFVRDLIHGRNFACDSIVDLARKEAWLTTVVSVLRQIMESAKLWDGTETISIEALSKEEAKYITLKGL